MKKLLPAGILGLAGLVGVGALTVPGTALVSSGDDDAAVKREDGVAELVLVDDVDDDDTADNTRTRTRGGAGSAVDDVDDDDTADNTRTRTRGGAASAADDVTSTGASAGSSAARPTQAGDDDVSRDVTQDAPSVDTRDGQDDADDSRDTDDTRS